MSEAGFSMLELVAVVAIISVLAALLVPMMSKGRESARRAVCLNNLRQIGMAFGTYVIDFKELPPHAVDPTKPSLSQLIIAQLGVEDGVTSVGLGILYPEYLSDERMFCCPSDTKGIYAWTSVHPDEGGSGGSGGKGKGWKAEGYWEWWSIRELRNRWGQKRSKWNKRWEIPAGQTTAVLCSYMYRGMTAMVGFENPASPDLDDDSNTGLVMDDNTGDLLRQLGISASSSIEVYRHDREGGNVLRGDGSVRWLPDPLRQCYVPPTGLSDPAQYARIWQWVDDQD